MFGRERAFIANLRINIDGHRAFFNVQHQLIDIGRACGFQLCQRGIVDDEVIVVIPGGLRGRLKVEVEVSPDKRHGLFMCAVLVDDLPAVKADMAEAEYLGEFRRRFRGGCLRGFLNRRGGCGGAGELHLEDRPAFIADEMHGRVGDLKALNHQRSTAEWQPGKLQFDPRKAKKVEWLAIGRSADQHGVGDGHTVGHVVGEAANFQPCVELLGDHRLELTAQQNPHHARGGNGNSCPKDENAQQNPRPTSPACGHQMLRMICALRQLSKKARAKTT